MCVNEEDEEDGKLELVELAKCLHMGTKRFITVITSTVGGNKPKGNLEHFYFEQKYRFILFSCYLTANFFFQSMFIWEIVIVDKCQI